MSTARQEVPVGLTLGQRLRALRLERGLSQADLAGELVSPSYVSLIEADRRSPERDVLEGLAARLGCSALYLESGVTPEHVNEQRLRLKFAEIALANGELDEAHQQFWELATHGAGELKYAATWGLARTDETRRHLHEALVHTDALLDASRAGEVGAPGLLTLFNFRCRIYRTAGDLTRSIEVGEEALREVRDLGLEGTEDEIRLASTLVGSYWARGDLFTAEHLAVQVIERAERLGSAKAQGNAYWNASTVAASRGQLALALDLAAKTLALLAESSPDRTLAAMRINYAWLLLQCDPPRLDEADAHLARAHEVLAASAAGPRLAECETEMARSALMRGDAIAAMRLAGQAMTRCADSGGTELQLARVVSGLAQLVGGQAEQGSLIASDAATALAVLGSRLEAARAWRDLAEALIEHDRPLQAVEALRQAADCAGARPMTIRPGLAVVRPGTVDLGTNIELVDLPVPIGD
jgi:transcriptional regulator with XRE-family HTH domain